MSEVIVHLLAIKRIKRGLSFILAFDLTIDQLAIAIPLATSDRFGRRLMKKYSSLVVADFIGGFNHLFRRRVLEPRIEIIPVLLCLRERAVEVGELHL